PLDIGQAQRRGVDHRTAPDHHHRRARGMVAPQRRQERIEASRGIRAAREEQPRYHASRQGAHPRAPAPASSHGRPSEADLERADRTPNAAGEDRQRARADYLIPTTAQRYTWSVVASVI